MQMDWTILLRIARSLIRQVNSADTIIDRWSLGGGTALMLHIGHRASRDIDIFLTEPQQLSYLDPSKRDFDFEIAPSDYTGDGSAFLKLVFADVGEIDFIVALSLSPIPTSASVVEGAAILLETVPEIIAKKVYYRGAHLKPRDIFDIAASAEHHRDSMIGTLRGYKREVSVALAAMDELNPDFVSRAISQLAIQPGFEPIARTATERAKEILRAV
jgi:hypothetical protein